MSMWQYFVCVDGYIKAHGSEDPGKLNAGEVDEIWEWMQGKD